MDIEIYKQKRDEIIKRLYKSGEKLGKIASRLAIDTNLVRDIVGLERVVEENEKVFSVIKGRGY